MTLRSTLSICALLILFVCSHSAMAEAEGPIDSPWQTKRLLHPTDRQVALEKSGKVFVYYGLTDKTVDRAIASNFDRIEYMMFAHTIKTNGQGEPLRSRRTGQLVVEDDGC